MNALLEGPLRHANTPRERQSAERQVAVARGLCRSLIGDELADALRLPRDHHRHWALAIRTTLRLLELTRRDSPRVNAFVQLLGRQYWDWSIKRGLGDTPARYDLPERLTSVGR